MSITAIHEAAKHGNLAEVVHLVETKAFAVDEKDGTGWTPLMYAILNDHREMFTWLLEKGADANVITTDGDYTPLIIASSEARSAWFVEVLVDYIDEASLNERNSYGQSALHLAVRRDRVEVCKILIHEGAEVNAKDKEWNTPLHFSYRSYELSELLLQNGALVDSENMELLRPIHLAAEDGNAHVCKLLIEHGASLAMREGKTPLHCAAEDGHRNTCEILLENGAFINALDEDGFTPLDLAMRRGHVRVVKFLFDNEAKTGDRIRGAAKRRREEEQPSIASSKRIP